MQQTNPAITADLMALPLSIMMFKASTFIPTAIIFGKQKVNGRREIILMEESEYKSPISVGKVFG